MRVGVPDRPERAERRRDDPGFLGELPLRGVFGCLAREEFPARKFVEPSQEGSDRSALDEPTPLSGEDHHGASHEGPSRAAVARRQRARIR